MAELRISIHDLLARLPASTVLTGDRAQIISSVEIDSRRVKPGSLFVALRGAHADGHDFVKDAVANGAVAIVVEGAHALTIETNAAIVHVPNSRRALSSIAAAFYADPSHALDVIGVTGTNGKTTTTRMIAAICNAAEFPCGVIGTVGAEFGARRWILTNTTPLPPELHGILAQMRDDGARCVALEVSSHALDLDRVEDVRFRVAALTNISRDHLDFHETIEAYAAAKHRLFAMANACVLNLDDRHGAAWRAHEAARVPTLTYALEASADIVAHDIVVTAAGSRFQLDGTAFELRLPGRFNVANALAAIGVARTLGIDDATSARGLLALERVPGRMEHLRGGEIDVVVDYAHTPDALDSALRALRETSAGALTVVFGCGGDRDYGKRAEMGAAAARYADRIVVTNDNPRSEDPQAIANAIVIGIGTHAYRVELDRQRAIKTAIVESAPGDIVLIAGKGHETYQIIGDQILEFNDASVAREALARRGAQS